MTTTAADVEIRSPGNSGEVEECAHLMAASEPWVTLGIGYEKALQILEGDGRELYVAFKQGDFVGFVVLQMAGALRGYIQDIAVMSEWRGRGIGNSIMEFAEQRIFRDTPNVFLCVSSYNHRAQRLYKTRGYEYVGELKDYLRTGQSEILMRKTRGPLLGEEERC